MPERRKRVQKVKGHKTCPLPWATISFRDKERAIGCKMVVSHHAFKLTDDNATGTDEPDLFLQGHSTTRVLPAFWWSVSRRHCCARTLPRPITHCADWVVESLRRHLLVYCSVCWRVRFSVRAVTCQQLRSGSTEDVLSSLYKILCNCH